MGLDMTAYRQLLPRLLPPGEKSFDPCSDEWFDNRSETFVHTWAPHAAEGLPDSDALNEGRYLAVRVYDTSDCESFRWRAGSYGGYSDFRRELALLSGFEPEIIWEHPEVFEGVPFFELIHYSDCDGWMGPVACRNLLEDFRRHREEFAEKHPADHPFIGHLHKYDKWIAGLEFAADDGALEFH